MPGSNEQNHTDSMILQVLHADSLAGPMDQLKAAFEAKYEGIDIRLISGRSKELAEQILQGRHCDVFASSDPRVIEETLMGCTLNEKDVFGAQWFIVFSRNEMVMVTQKGNPHDISKVSDLGRDYVKWARVTGSKDLAAKRTMAFIEEALNKEKRIDLLDQIIKNNAVKVGTIPEAVQFVLEKEEGHASIVYLSAAMAAGGNLHIVSFPSEVNLSDQIQNAVTIPATAKNKKLATSFIHFLISSEAHQILKQTGQPPIIPALKTGRIPPEIY